MRKLFVLILLLAIIPHAITVQAASPPLWTNCLPHEHEKRCRYVELMPDLDSRVYNVTLFQGVRYKLIKGETSEQNNCIIITGHIAGEPVGYFYIVELEGVYLIHIATPDGVWEVSRESGNIYRISELTFGPDA